MIRKNFPPTHTPLCNEKLEWKSCFLADAEGLHKGQCVYQVASYILPPQLFPVVKRLYTCTVLRISGKNFVFRFPVAIDNTVHSCYKLWPRHCGDHGRYCSTATALSAAGKIFMGRPGIVSALITTCTCTCIGKVHVIPQPNLCISPCRHTHTHRQLSTTKIRC